VPKPRAKAEKAERPKLMRVRATINLPGLGHNQIAVVDPTVKYIADCLRDGYVVPEPAESATMPA
jgi:hypothetical protein